MRNITSRIEMVSTLLQIAYDSNLVGAIQEDASEWSTDLNWMSDLTKTQQATLETDFVSRCISLANSLMNEKELDISENDPLALLDYKEYDLADIQDSTNVELNNLKAENEILTKENQRLKNELVKSDEMLSETTDAFIDKIDSLDRITLKFYRKESYGRTLYYPNCDNSKAIASIANRNTFPKNTVRTLHNMLGGQMEIKQGAFVANVDLENDQY